MSVVGAVLDGAKVPRKSPTRFKTSSKGRVDHPSRVLDQRFTLELPLARHRRDGDTCGFDTDIELEYSPVS